MEKLELIRSVPGHGLVRVQHAVGLGAAPRLVLHDAPVVGSQITLLRALELGKAVENPKHLHAAPDVAQERAGMSFTVPPPPRTQLYKKEGSS